MCRCFEMSQKEHLASCSQLFLVYSENISICAACYQLKWWCITKSGKVKNNSKKLTYSKRMLSQGQLCSLHLNSCLCDPTTSFSSFFKNKAPRLGHLFIDNVFLDKCDLFSLRLGILSLLPPGSECAVWLGVCGVWMFSPCLSGFSWLLPQHKDTQLVGSG